MFWQRVQYFSMLVRYIFDPELSVRCRSSAAIAARLRALQSRPLRVHPAQELFYHFHVLRAEAWQSLNRQILHFAEAAWPFPKLSKQSFVKKHVPSDQL